MHHCPKCHYEYESCVSVCPDCGAQLVDKPASTTTTADYSAADCSTDDDDSDVLLLFESHDYLKLRFLLDLLDQEGIPYATRKLTQHGGSMKSEFLSAGLSATSTVRGDTRVYVTAENFEQARDLLAELEGIELTGDEEIDLEDKS
jgi:hypothetical protein